MAAPSITTTFRVRDAQMRAASRRAIVTLKRIGTTAVAVGRAVGRAFLMSAAIVGGAVALFVRAAIKQEDAEAKLAAVLKATSYAAGLAAEQLYEQAAALQAVTVFGDEVIMETQAIIATFKGIKADTFKRTTEAVLDMATVMGTDAKSSAIMLGKALNDPAVGMTYLQRTGIMFTESQKEMVKTLQASGNMLGAQTLILREVESQFGGAAVAAGQTFGGQLKRLWNRMGDVAERIGDELIPLLVGLKKHFEELATVLESLTAVEMRQFIMKVEGIVIALVGLKVALAVGAINVFAGALIAAAAVGAGIGGFIAAWWSEQAILNEVIAESNERLQELTAEFGEAHEELTKTKGLDAQAVALRKIIVTCESTIAAYKRLQKETGLTAEQSAGLAEKVAYSKKVLALWRVELKKTETAQKAATAAEVAAAKAKIANTKAAKEAAKAAKEAAKVAEKAARDRAAALRDLEREEKAALSRAQSLLERWRTATAPKVTVTGLEEYARQLVAPPVEKRDPTTDEIRKFAAQEAAANRRRNAILERIVAVVSISGSAPVPA